MGEIAAVIDTLRDRWTERHGLAIADLMSHVPGNHFARWSAGSGTRAADILRRLEAALSFPPLRRGGGCGLQLEYVACVYWHFELREGRRCMGLYTRY